MKSKPTLPRQPQVDSLFLRRIGQQVRAARAARGLTRKELALVSATSERYLAQIEAGSGNPSILVLSQIAEATRIPVGQLIGDSTFDLELLQILGTVQQLPEKRRLEFGNLVNDWINNNNELGKQQKIALIGLRGAGKSTLARLVANQLEIPFVELTHEIELTSGLAIQEIFSLYGEQGYRELENQCLKVIAANHQRVILAVAGGITGDSNTFSILCNQFHTIWLKASPEEHMQRVLAQGDKRPVTGFSRAMEALRNILLSREHLYAQAEFSIDTSDKSIDDSSQALTTIVRQICKPQIQDMS